MRVAIRRFVLLAFILPPAVGPETGLAQPARPGGDNAATVAALEQTLVDVIARAERSVVAIARTAPDDAPRRAPPMQDLFGDLRQPAPEVAVPYATAAGVIIDPAGLVLSEYLAIREGDRHTVTTVDGTEYPATIKAADPRSGLAMLSLEAAGDGEPGSLPAIPLGDASQLRKGQFVVAIGNPFAIRSDGEPTASWGIVTNLARKAPAGANLNNVRGALDDYRTTIHHLGTLIQTDAKLGWSAGGGALVNLRGELVGLTTTVATIAGHEQPAGYAIPLDGVIRRIIDTLKEGREVEYGLLGVTFRPRDAGPRSRRSGEAVVSNVVPGSPAAHAGLQPGDVITRVAGRRIDDIDAIQLAISTIRPSQPVTIDIERASRPTTVRATLAKLPVPGRKIVTDRPPNWRGMRIDFATAFGQQRLAEQIAAGGLDKDGSVVVTEVDPDSPAWNAGVRPGMFISHVDGQRVTTPAEFRSAIEAAGAIGTLRLTEPISPAGGPASAELRIGAPD